MKRVLWLLGLLLAAIPARAADGIDWKPWSDSIFAQAAREHKFVLLDLQAVWCHWCHVMDEKTYADSRVIALIRSRYIAVRVDQDAHPDLANRYQDYGWPATVVFNSDGSEIVKRAGYLPPEQMRSMLQAIIDDPTPGPSVTSVKPPHLAAGHGAADVATLKAQLAAGYDHRLGGWGTDQKFLNWDNVECSLADAHAGDAEAEKRARQTLAAQLKLVDPVWGGVDQYSAEGDWDHPHFEKIMQFQAENVRIYAEAHAQWKDAADLDTAKKIHGYVRAFLTSPDGVVYVSQDADLVDGQHAGEYFQLDDAARRKLGVPRIDRHIYARENGWYIQALAALFASTGDASYRDEATRAADWIIAHRSLPGGGFRHGEETSGPTSLGDTLAMGRAFLALHAITADRAWLDRAAQAAHFIDAQFPYRVGGKIIGYATARDESAASHFTPQPDFDENVYLARFTNLLAHETGDANDRQIAENALRFAADPEIATARHSSVGALILALREFASDPLHVAVVGRKDDPNTQKLFQAALAYPQIYKQVEWVDPARKSTASDAVIYPELPHAAAFVCANAMCSAPVFDPAALVALLDRKTRQ